MRDEITLEELNNRTSISAGHFISKRINKLFETSGANNVTSACVKQRLDKERSVIVLQVVFNSAAWTGRYA